MKVYENNWANIIFSTIYKGYGGGGGDGGYEERTDTVFVSGLPPMATEVDIAGYFGQIGIVKVREQEIHNHRQSVFDRFCHSVRCMI